MRPPCSLTLVKLRPRAPFTLYDGRGLPLGSQKGCRPPSVLQEVDEREELVPDRGGQSNSTPIGSCVLNRSWLHRAECAASEVRCQSPKRIAQPYQPQAVPKSAYLLTESPIMTSGRPCRHLRAASDVKRRSPQLLVCMDGASGCACRARNNSGRGRRRLLDGVALASSAARQVNFPSPIKPCKSLAVQAGCLSGSDGVGNSRCRHAAAAGNGVHTAAASSSAASSKPAAQSQARGLAS